MFLSSKIFLKASLRLKLSWKECHGGLWWEARWAQVTNPFWRDSCASGGARLDVPVTSVARPVSACSHQGKGRKCASSIDLTRKWWLQMGFKAGRDWMGWGSKRSLERSGRSRAIAAGVPGHRAPFSVQTIREVDIILLQQQMFILVQTFKFFTD